MLILFLAFVVLYVLFMFFVMSKTIKPGKKYQFIVVPIVFIILLLIPTWDYLLGKQIFDGYCEKAGLHIYEDIEKVDSIYVENNRAYYFLESGYKFIEVQENENFYKYYFNKDNSNCIEKNTNWLKSRECISKVKISKPISLYKLIDSSSNKKMSSFFNINKNTYRTLYKLDINTKVAEIINYHWDRGWFHRIVGLSRGTQCNYKLDVYNELKLKMIQG